MDGLGSRGWDGSRLDDLDGWIGSRWMDGWMDGSRVDG